MKQLDLAGNETLSSFKQVKKQVIEILEHYPETRNNLFYCQLLCMKYYAHVDLPFIPYDQIRKVSGSLETVRRTRQKIQNEEKLFPPTDPAILERRRRREQDIRNNIHEV